MMSTKYCVCSMTCKGKKNFCAILAGVKLHERKSMEAFSIEQWYEHNHSRTQIYSKPFDSMYVNSENVLLVFLFSAE